MIDRMVYFPISQFCHPICKYLTIILHGRHPVPISIAGKKGAIRGRFEGEISSSIDGQAAEKVPPGHKADIIYVTNYNTSGDLLFFWGDRIRNHYLFHLFHIISDSDFEAAVQERLSLILKICPSSMCIY